MPKSTPLPSPSSQVPSPRASNGPRPDFPECNDKGDGAESPGLYSSRQSISPFEGTVSEQDINPDSDRREKSRKGRRSEVGESHRDELNQVDVSYGASATPPQRHNPSNRSVQERPRGRPQTHLKPQNGSTVFRKTSRQLTSPPSQQLSGPRADSTARISRIGPPRTFSTGAKAAYDSSIYRGTSDYELMDIAHYYCDVPNDSPIITATVYCADVMSALYAKSSALRWNLLGNKGEVIRTIKLSSDSWLVIGYRHDDCGAPKLCSGRGSMQRSTDRETGRHSNAINYDAVHPETYGNEKYEDEDEDVSDNGYMLSGKRTHVPWKESDGQRLLSYKDKMGLDWDDIVFRFPGRSVGAVKLRYYTLHKKDS
ncbi:hypothetical protein EJ05DRAFT_269252 [Pseudovirgaria hyperparasitica]|uniref:Myb-like domain-containing protein n=1 Tax=Pseudovirgaria hyperparasitica TaxID=470096 RepID=A0A6A6VTV6_9PEZI|nr:uncharacterized protein EJ05DRAFT_269252 [Pseudovirgaria hyperparasitica]KAF2752677.1 hypothetical protein EJ05DRAFT_269252 [Pseudovirgaria hyperparasitica]